MIGRSLWCVWFESVYCIHVVFMFSENSTVSVIFTFVFPKNCLQRFVISKGRDFCKRSNINIGLFSESSVNKEMSDSGKTGTVLFFLSFLSLTSSLVEEIVYHISCSVLLMTYDNH